MVCVLGDGGSVFPESPYKIHGYHKIFQTDELLEASPTQCQRTYSIFSLFTSGTWLALVSLNIAFQFIVIVMVYYGLSFAAGSLPGSIYINNVISGVVELVAYILTYFTLDKLGRKKLTAGPLILAGFSMILGMYNLKAQIYWVFSLQKFT